MLATMIGVTMRKHIKQPALDDETLGALKRKLLADCHDGHLDARHMGTSSRSLLDRRDVLLLLLFNSIFSRLPSQRARRRDDRPSSAKRAERDACM